MDTATILELVKARIGLRSSVRDAYLEAIIDGVVGELEGEQGVVLVKDNPHHLMFVVDLSTWRYQNRDSLGGMPRHLQFRLHNLIIKSAGAKNDI